MLGQELYISPIFTMEGRKQCFRLGKADIISASSG
jgi:hypothetical protein